MSVMKRIVSKRAIWNWCLAHIMGFLITLSAIVLMILICIAAFHDGYPVNDGFNQDFLYGACSVFWWKWVAEKTSTNL